MASGGKAAGHEAAKAAEGVIAKEAKQVLEKAEQVGVRAAAHDAERSVAHDAERSVAHDAERSVASDVTTPTGARGGTPTGKPTKIDAGQDANVRRSLERENETAGVLADNGYRTHQNPTRQEVADARQATGDTGNPNKDPDYLVEGRVFDCYSPNETKNVRGIASEVEDKIVKEQTQRVVVDLQNWRGDVGALQKQFTDWPIPGLKEVKVIGADGAVTHIHL